MMKGEIVAEQRQSAKYQYVAALVGNFIADTQAFAMR